MKRLAATALICFGIVGCGGSDDTNTTTVTSTVTAPSGQGAATSYAGTTDQGLPVTIVATPNAVLDFSFGWRAPCADGQERTNSIRIGGAPIRDGSFSFDSVLETGGVAEVEGEIDGNSASGTLSRSKGTAFGVNCKVTGVSWEADAASQGGIGADPGAAS